MAINALGGYGFSASSSQQPPVSVASGTVGAGTATVATPSVAPASSQSASVQHADVQKALESLKQAIKPTVSDSLRFSIDQDSGKTVVKVVDAQTDQVIRQIPSEEVLEIAKDLERMKGLFLRQQA